jgi:hypothetical protein
MTRSDDAVDAYRDRVSDLTDYCADKVAEHDPSCASRGTAFERLRFRLLGVRGALRAKGLSARFRRLRLHAASALGLTPRMEPATWVTELPLGPAPADAGTRGREDLAASSWSRASLNNELGTGNQEHG